MGIKLSLKDGTIDGESISPREKDAINTWLEECSSIMAEEIKNMEVDLAVFGSCLVSEGRHIPFTEVKTFPQGLYRV